MEEKTDNFVVVPLYECDPNKNYNCPRGVCHITGGPCSLTFDKNCAKNGTTPITTKVHKDIWAMIEKGELR